MKAKTLPLFISVILNCAINNFSFASCVMASISPAHVSCYDLMDGSATVFASNGILPYSYLWSNGKTSSAINKLFADVYSVTVTDAANCTAFALITVTQPLKPSFACYITNETIDVTHKIYTFDLYLLNTSTQSFEYAEGKYQITVNTNVANGGTLTPSIVTGSSQLYSNQVPMQVALSALNNYALKIPERSPPGRGLGTIISNVESNGCVSPGTRIATIKISNTNEFAANSHMNHKFDFEYNNLKIFAYLCGQTGDSINTNVTALGIFYDTVPGTCLKNINLNPQFLSVEENSSGINRIAAYPNPAHQTIQVSNLSQFSTVRLKISDTMSKIVMEKNIINYGDTKINIDISTLAEGLYFIVADTRKEILIARFLKE